MEKMMSDKKTCETCVAEQINTHGTGGTARRCTWGVDVNMAYPHSFSCSRYVRKPSLPHTYHCPLPDGARCDHLTDTKAEADRAWREEAERIRPLLVEARDALHSVEALMIGSHPVESDRLCAVIPLDLGRRISKALAKSRPGDAHKVEEHARSAESCRGQHEEQTREELQAQLDREIAQHTACLLIAEGTALDTFSSYWFPASGAMIAVEKLRQDCVQLRAREELRAASLFARSGRAGGCGDGAMSQPWEPPTTDAAKKVTP